MIVGSIASNFVPKNRKQIILWGVIGAFVFKIFFAIFATFLFEFYFIKILGGLLLVWIVNDLRKDLVDIKSIKPSIKMIEDQAINCKSGKRIPCKVDTICLHGDGKTAVNLAKTLRDGFIKRGINLKKLNNLTSLK